MRLSASGEPPPLLELPLELPLKLPMSCSWRKPLSSSSAAAAAAASAAVTFLTGSCLATAHQLRTQRQGQRIQQGSCWKAKQSTAVRAKAAKMPPMMAGRGSEEMAVEVEGAVELLLLILLSGEISSGLCSQQVSSFFSFLPWSLEPLDPRRPRDHAAQRLTFFGGFSIVAHTHTL